MVNTPCKPGLSLNHLARVTLAVGLPYLLVNGALHWLSRRLIISTEKNKTHTVNILVFRPFQLQQKEKTNSSYKHNSKVSHGIFSLTFRMLQHTSSEVTVTKSDEI